MKRKANKSEQPQAKAWNPFRAGQLHLGRRPALESGCSIQRRFIEENSFSLSCRYQLEIASWLGVGPHVYFLFAGLGFCVIWICAGLVLAVTVSELISALVLLCAEEAFLGVIHYLWILYYFWLLFYIDLLVLREGLNKDILFRTKSSKVSFCLHIVCLWVFAN